MFFFDILQRKKISTISNINKSNSWAEKLFMITEYFLFIGGNNKISLINVHKHNLIRVIDVQGSSNIYDFCLLNEKIILTGDNNGIMNQFRIEGDNLIFVSKKEKTHNSYISSLLYLGNNKLASGSGDSKIRIW